MCTDHDLDLFVFVPVDHDLDLPVSIQIMIQTCMCVYRSRFGPVLSVCMLSSIILLLLVIFTGDSWRLGVCYNMLYMCRIPKHSYLGHFFKNLLSNLFVRPSESGSSLPSVFSRSWWQAHRCFTSPTLTALSDIRERCGLGSV